MNKYQPVFDCHPGVDEIFVVDGMPFLNAAHAQSHSNTTNKPVELIKRDQAGDPEDEAAEAAGDPEGDAAEPIGEPEGGATEAAGDPEGDAAEQSGDPEGETAEAAVETKPEAKPKRKGK